jgi:serine/threonine protein kinase
MAKSIKKRRYTTKNRTINNNKWLGGNMFASGGFGCVFYPALRCKGSNIRPSNHISKLMSAAHADDEYKELNKFREKLKNIPNFGDYFLLNGITICSPEKLTDKDLKHVEKCKPLMSVLHSAEFSNSNKDVNKSSILKKLKILTMPFGGITVESFIDYNLTHVSNLLLLHKHLIRLYFNGIRRMNGAHVYHSDIKSSNVLVNFKKTDDITNIMKNNKKNKNKNKNNKNEEEEEEDKLMKTRLIDWGLSCEYYPGEQIPRVWRNRPLQFNLPFSIVLFSDYFQECFQRWDRLTTSVENFVSAFLDEWLIKRGNGHYDSILVILSIIYFNKSNENKSKNYYRTIIVSYLVHIVERLTTIQEYIDNTYIHLVDLWGFLIMYLPIGEHLYNCYASHTPEQRELFVFLQSLYQNILYTPRLGIISPKVIYTQLVQFSSLLEKVSAIA